MTVGHALQDVSESGKGLDVVELCGGGEGADGCPSDAATVRAREQMVFAPERDGPDGALDRIVSSSMRPSSRNRVRAGQRASA